MLIRFFNTVNRFPKTILLIILALSAFFFYQAKEGLFDPQTGKIHINSTVEPFIERDSGAYQQFLEAREAFGSAEVLVVALHNRERNLTYNLNYKSLIAPFLDNVWAARISSDVGPRKPFFKIEGPVIF